MDKISRRSLLRHSSHLAGAVAALGPMTNYGTERTSQEPQRKLKVVVVGGHFDDPQSCCGGTMALYAALGHEVVALSLTGGPPPNPAVAPQDRQTRRRVEAIQSAIILGAQLVCLDYSGSNSGANGGPIVYRTGSEVTGERYDRFTEVLLGYQPDIVFTHWPIDFHMDHRAASLLTYHAWLRSEKKFPLYYMEAELGLQTQNFWPTHYVDITPVADRKREACFANSVTIQDWWPYHDAMHRMRGMEHGCKAAEAFNHHPQSPREPSLP
ncbi:MAG: PIG-L family deacetylase [Acidobacteriota bacterium]